MRLSIRRRLTLLNTLAVGVLLGGCAALTYALLDRALVQAVDARLLECRGEFEQDATAAADPARLRHLIDEFWEHEHVSAAVYGPGGLVLRTEELAADAVPPPPPAATADPAFRSAELPGLGRQRVLAVPLPNATDGRTVVLATSLTETDRTMAQLRAVLLTAVPVMLLVAAGVAYLLATRALAPVNALVLQARSITARSLDRRLPVANPHDELGRLAATVNDMVGRLERSFAEMRRFTADASHELRSPLAVIRAEAESALGRAAREDVQQMLGSALEECDRLARLSDQLLTLARQDAGILGHRLDPVNLAVLTAGVVETLRPLADVKGITLAVEPGAPAGEAVVRGDPDRLRQVLLNLLDNALKHTAAGSVTAQVKVTWAAVIVEVRDTGEGIPPEHLPHVFERFYRVDKARTREEGGTGLGLSIAKSIVEAHGGRIEMTSTPGQGTTCTVTLPRSTGPIASSGDTQ